MKRRIDRVLVFVDWFFLFTNAIVRNLQIRTFDHASIFLNLYMPTTPLFKPFHSLFKPFHFIVARYRDPFSKDVIT